MFASLKVALLLRRNKRSCTLTDSAYVETELAKMGTRAVAPLIKALGGNEERSRLVAAKMLGQLGDTRAFEPLHAAVKAGDMHVSKAAAESIRKLAPRAIEALLKALLDGDAHSRGSAAESLGKLGDPRAAEPLRKALEDGDSRVRGCAAEALGKLRDLTAVEPLLKALDDADSTVRRCAARALGGLGDPRTVEPLLKALAAGDSGVRWSAAWSLAELGDLRAVEPLIRALDDGDTHVSRNAASALGKLRDRRAVEPLLKMLGDRDANVRISVIMALQELGDSRAIEPLRKAANMDADTNICSIAKSSLAMLVRQLHPTDVGMPATTVNATRNTTAKMHTPVGPKETFHCPKCGQALSVTTNRIGDGGDAWLMSMGGFTQVRLECPKCRTLLDATLGDGVEYN